MHKFLRLLFLARRVKLRQKKCEFSVTLGPASVKFLKLDVIRLALNSYNWIIIKQKVEAQQWSSGLGR